MSHPFRSFDKKHFSFRVKYEHSHRLVSGKFFSTIVWTWIRMQILAAFTFYSHRRPPTTSTRRGSSPLPSWSRCPRSVWVWVCVCVCVCVCVGGGGSNQRMGQCWATLRKRPHFPDFTSRQLTTCLLICGQYKTHKTPETWMGLQFVGGGLF